MPKAKLKNINASDKKHINVSLTIAVMDDILLLQTQKHKTMYKTAELNFL